MNIQLQIVVERTVSNEYNTRLKTLFQLEQLYIEVLYTIANTVGASTGQYAHYKEDLYRYAQEAFGVPPDQHRRYLNIASEEKVRFIVFFPIIRSYTRWLAKVFKHLPRNIFMNILSASYETSWNFVDAVVVYNCSDCNSEI